MSYMKFRSLYFTRQGPQARTAALEEKECVEVSLLEYRWFDKPPAVLDRLNQT